MLPFKTQNTHCCRWLNLSKFTCFLGGPNRPKICVGRTKSDFKDRAPDHRNGSIASPRMCPDLFHFYSALFRQCRATTPSYGTKIIIFGHLGSFWGANRPPWPEKRLHCIAPGVPGKSKRCVLLQHHIETNRNYSNLFPKSNWGRRKSHTGFIE